MKKLISIFCILFLLTSCENNIVTNIKSSNATYVVQAIEIINSYEKDSVDNFSRYFVNTERGYTYYDNDISFIDSVGKFNVGDEIVANFQLKNDENNLKSFKYVERSSKEDSLYSLINKLQADLEKYKNLKNEK